MLKLFEKARKERAEQIVDGAYQNGKRMHLSSGAAAEERDAAFRKVRQGGPNPDKSADPETQSELLDDTSAIPFPCARILLILTTCGLFHLRIPLRLGLHAGS